MNVLQASTLVTKEDRIGIVGADNGRPINIKGGPKACKAIQELSGFGLISFRVINTSKALHILFISLSQLLN